MKAQEAAKWVEEHLECSDKQVLKLIPAYKNDLPKRAWLKKFKESLPQELRGRFYDLK
jgi:hypothetical protein